MRNKREISLEDRGNTLDFIIEEMPASKCESWIIRAVLLLAKSGGDDVPMGSDIKKALAYISSKGIAILAGIDYDKAKPLIGELLECCTYKNKDGVMAKLKPSNVDAIVGDVQTLFALKAEAFKVNFSFFNIGNPLQEEPVAKKQNTKITKI